MLVQHEGPLVFVTHVQAVKIQLVFIILSLQEISHLTSLLEQGTNLELRLESHAAVRSIIENARVIPEVGLTFLYKH